MVDQRQKAIGEVSLARLSVNLNMEHLRLCILKSLEAKVYPLLSVHAVFSSAICLSVLSGASVARQATASVNRNSSSSSSSSSSWQTCSDTPGLAYVLHNFQSFLASLCKPRFIFFYDSIILPICKLPLSEVQIKMALAFNRLKNVNVLKNGIT